MPASEPARSGFSGPNQVRPRCIRGSGRWYYGVTLMLCLLIGCWQDTFASDLAVLTPIWSAPKGPAQSVQGRSWLETLRRDLASAPPECAHVPEPPIDQNRAAQAFRLELVEGVQSEPLIVTLKDPVASTFVVVASDVHGCPLVYFGGRWFPFSQREYLSPFPNTLLPALENSTALTVVIQDDRVLRPWVQVLTQTEFRRDHLILWMALAAVLAALLVVLSVMRGFVGRNSTVTAYVTYVASFMWWIAEEYGVNSAWFPDYFPASTFLPIQCVSVALVTLGVTWTVIEFLALQGFSRALLAGGQGGSALAFVAAIWWPPGYRVGSFILGVNAVVTLVLLVRYLRHSDLPAKLFATGFVATMIGGGIQSLSVALPSSNANQFAVHAYAVGGLVQVFFWLGAITLRMQRERAILVRWRRQELELQVRKATAELELKKQVAEEATRAKSDFLAAASHDLRQPTHALGMLIARLGQFPMADSMRQVQRSLEAAAHAMQDLLDELMDFSRLDMGTEHVVPCAVDTSELLQGLHDTLEPLATAKGLRLRIRPSAISVWSEPVLLRRMVMNLALNAIRYTASGTVLISVRSLNAGRSAAIQVWDSGIGIDQSEQQHIFKEFYQVANRARERDKGIGLGLSIVQRSAELLGHTVLVRSSLGCGSRFTLVLKQASEASRVTPAVNQSETQAHSVDESLNFDGLVVLVIENDPLSRIALQELLVSWGCDVLVAGNAVQALELACGDSQPGLIVTDYRLDDAGNGIEVISNIRASLGRDIPACVVSGDMDSTLMDQIRGHDMNLLHKPVRPAKLRSLMRRMLQTS